MSDEANIPILQDPRVSPPDVPESADFPHGFWARIGYLLQDTEKVAESLRRDENTWEIARILFAITVVMAGLYGGVMGATNLLQGADVVLSDKFAAIAVTFFKVPVLFLFTLLIVIPPIYVSNAFVGSRLTLGQITAFLLAACAVTSVVLASCATVVMFFALTSKSYHFIKLLHVIMFVYAGVSGLIYLNRTLTSAAWAAGRQAPGGLFFIWLLLYMFVGTQLAWVLRPFVGNPGDPFQVFRPRGGNFYESVIQSLLEFFKNFD